MVAREAGDWERVTQLGKELKLSLSFVAETSNEAMRWAHQITNSAGAPPVGTDQASPRKKS
jgi:hypothetical protein